MFPPSFLKKGYEGKRENLTGGQISLFPPHARLIKYFTLD